MGGAEPAVPPDPDVAPEPDVVPEPGAVPELEGVPDDDVPPPVLPEEPEPLVEPEEAEPPGVVVPAPGVVVPVLGVPELATVIVTDRLAEEPRRSLQESFIVVLRYRAGVLWRPLLLTGALWSSLLATHHDAPGADQVT